MALADLNDADFVGLDYPPCQTLRPGSHFSAPVFVSHWDRRPLDEASLKWRISAIDRFGDTRAIAKGARAVEPRRFGVTEAGTIECDLPPEVCLVTVACWLEDRQGIVRARNYVNVDVYSSRLVQEIEQTTGSSYALRFLPGDFLGSSWLDPRMGPRGSKLGASGAGWVEPRGETRGSVIASFPRGPRHWTWATPRTR